MSPATPALAELIERLIAVTATEPVLTASELRPFVERLEARRRRCEWAPCGRVFLQRSLSQRGHAFCGDACRMAFHRKRKTDNMRNNSRKALTTKEGR